MIFNYHSNYIDIILYIYVVINQIFLKICMYVIMCVTVCNHIYEHNRTKFVRVYKNNRQIK